MFLYYFSVGTILGSFLNVVVSRLLKHESFVFTRSHCVICQHQLKFYELIPIISYLVQLGHCRSCQTKIPFYIFLYELTMGFSFFIFPPNTIKNIILLIFLIVLHIIALLDLLTFTFDFRLVIILLIMGLMQQNFDYIGIYLGIYLLITLLNNQFHFIGNGDIDIIFIIIITFGIKKSSLILLIASILGIINIMAVKQKLIPFIPCLYLSTLFNLLILF